jgi:histidinol-phosphate aminotransferase
MKTGGKTAISKQMNKARNMETLMNQPTPRPGIMDIHAYQPGDSKIPGIDKVIKLASNESPLGPSPKVIEALRHHLNGLELYPDSSAGDVRQALGHTHGLDPTRILCTTGSEDVLHLIAKAYAGPGDEILYSQYGFIAYPIAAQAVGATPVKAPEKNFTADVDALLAAVTPRTKILFLANPNNPTGTYLREQEIERLRSGLPKNVMLVLDAAYAEYVDRPDYNPGTALVDGGNDNVVVTRTFSKIYGMAGMRLGWTYCPASVTQVLNRIRGTFNIPTLTQIAGIAALSDPEHIAAAKAHNLREIALVTEGLEAAGLSVTPSVGNFLIAHFPGGPDEAKAADSYLRSKGIIVRPIAAYGLPQCLRITIGRETENRLLVKNLQDFRSRT